MTRRSLLWMALLIALAASLRLSFAVPRVWDQPWTPHHFDEHILPYEALALWEGVTPREVGWPASTFRLALSAVYGAQFVAAESHSVGSAPNAAAAMGVVARWSGERVGDATPLYVSGRVLSALIGVAQVIAAVAAGRAWLGPSGGTVAGVIATLSPLAVSHSQLLLADVWGAFFATWSLALLPGVAAGRRSPVGPGVLMGLAAGSKFHFGLWLLVALVACSIDSQRRLRPWRDALTRSSMLLVAFGLTLVALVPWLVINPVLGLKEFAGVVLVKAGAGRTMGSMLVTAWQLLSALGVVTLVGLVLGVRPFLRATGVLGGAVVAAFAIGWLVLSSSAIVFDRYALVLLPAAGVVGAQGWQMIGSSMPRVPGLAWVVVMLLAGLPQALKAIDDIRRVNSYHLAHAWMAVHLPDRAAVAIYSEDNQHLARHPDQLTECVDYVESDAAYREKWLTNGIRVDENSGRPMARAVLADEQFQAFWCAREALAPRSPSFLVQRFHADARFQTLRTRDLERKFRAGLTDPAAGLDAVLVHFDLFPDLLPARTFTTPAGPTLRLYLRPGVRLRSAAGID
jgi:hypothetical protein